MTNHPFRTWLVVGTEEDPACKNILKNLDGRFGDFDLSNRPHVSLEWSKDRLLLRTKEPDRVFDWIERKGVSALSLAPYSELRQFDNKLIRNKGRRYLVQCCDDTELPYYRRLLSIKLFDFEIAPDTQHEEHEFESPLAPNEERLLWIDPELVELDSNEVSSLFDSGSSRRALASDLKTAFLLPPVRTTLHRSRSRLSSEPLTRKKAPYFSPSLVALREVVRKAAGYAVPQAEEPSIVTLVRLVDEPLIRDFLLDGASVAVLGEEGQPTEVRLCVSGGSEPGSRYRASALLDSLQAEGPKWGGQLLQEIRQDVEGLLPKYWGVLAVPPRWSGQPASDCEKQASLGALTWESDVLRGYRQGGSGGTWEHLKLLRDRLATAPPSDSLFEERVTEPTRARVGNGPEVEESPPDNDLAEKLFVTQLWRCPWTDAPDEPSWRHATVELLRNDFALLGPEARVDSWNSRPRNAEETNEAFTFSHFRRGSDGAFILRYSGVPNYERIKKWRLLLPLGAIINARTIILDAGPRSVLDRGFVLA